MNKWTTEEAIALCKAIHPMTNKHGCYVALTGGVLYKDGPRKDLDLLFYRIRQVPAIDKKKLFIDLQTLGIKVVKGWGWCHKAVWKGRTIDLFFPEEDKFATEIVHNLKSGPEAVEDDPDPDPRPEDHFDAAMEAGQCMQGLGPD